MLKNTSNIFIYNFHILVFYLVSHKGFTMKQTVLAYIAEVTRVREDSLTYNDVMRFEPKIQSFLRGLKVTYEIPKVLKRTYRVIKLSKETSYSEFINSDNQKLTIKQYFLNSKRYNIKKPELPTLHVSTKADGSEILLPIEVRKFLYFLQIIARDILKILSFIVMHYYAQSTY